MKRTLAKICSVIPFAVYGFALLILALAFQFPHYFEQGILEDVFGVVFFGWIPSLAGALAGVVFSLLALKERHGKLFLVCSCVNVAVSIAWGWFALRMMLGIAWGWFALCMMLGSAWWQRL